MMTLLWPILALTLLLMRPVGVPAADAGSSLPSPMKRMIIVHGIPGGSDPATIDADTSALLDEAAQTANGDDSAFILLKHAPDRAGMDSDATRTNCQAEALRAYLIGHGIDVRRVSVDMEDELPLPLLSRSTCERGRPLRHLAN